MIDRDEVLNVIPPGALACFESAREIKVLVKSVCVTDNCVTYKVTWMNGRTRHEEWVSAAEIQADEPSSKKQIGFSAPPK